MFDPVWLSRLQFALTIGFHILFPVLTIGLGVYLVVVEGLWLATRDDLYYRLYRFWVKLFAINFAVGVVTGVVMEFEFGTNWARFSVAAADVFSPLLFFEVLTAFFLEAGFLGIMLFGWRRVARPVHFAATCIVAGGALLSAAWILGANSWMQTPQGYLYAHGRFLVTSFAAAIFNPSFLARLAHMVVASFATTAFAVAGLSALFLLRGRHLAFSRRSLGIALLMAALCAPLQVYLGDVSGRGVFRNQPAKLAAMESHWETNTAGGAPFTLLAIPDTVHETNRFALTIPDGLSLLVTHSRGGRVLGLKAFPPSDRPNVPVVYFAFRIMVAIGFLYLSVMLWAAALWMRGTLFTDRRLLWTLLLIHPLGWVAVEAGWVTAEVGRQPWLIYNLVRTRDGLSAITAGQVQWSLALFAVIFLAIGGSYFFYVLGTLGRGPDTSSPIPPLQRPAGMRPPRAPRPAPEP